jgi:glycosyltransferase involved in cell wall biosynthesis
LSKPILIISDAPTAPTGLGRICRELAQRMNDDGGFRVGTFGYGGTYSSKLGFPNYPMTKTVNYVATELVEVWNDFAGDEEGIILTIWNASWCNWLANPKILGEGPLKDFLMAKPFELWGYFPIDGDCANGTLPRSIGETIGGYDRVLAYTEFGAKAIEKTVPFLKGKVPFLPHGLDISVFYPRDRAEARQTFVARIVGKEPAALQEDLFLIGVVATNTPRKDWYLAFEACARMIKNGMKVGMWAHTDKWRAFWDLESLQAEFGMQDRVMFTNRNLTDDELAWGYSACDVTFGIGSGEGWGYPLAESLACGVPCVHGDYAGGAEIVPCGTLVAPVVYRGDGVYGIRRPVFDADAWAQAAGLGKVMNTVYGKLPDYIGWDNAWPRWKKWLLEGLL